MKRWIKGIKNSESGEMADALDLGSSVAIRESSSLSSRTNLS